MGRGVLKTCVTITIKLYMTRTCLYMTKGSNWKYVWAFMWSVPKTIEPSFFVKNLLVYQYCLAVSYLLVYTICSPLLEFVLFYISWNYRVQMTSWANIVSLQKKMQFLDWEMVRKCFERSSRFNINNLDVGLGMNTEIKKRMFIRLTHFKPMFVFYTHWKHSKNMFFIMFLRNI